jgi:hypothetical protein
MISVLCALPDSVYYQMGLDVWDIQRDAYFFTGSNPVIVHPPCAQWSRLSAFSKPNESEKELAYFCLTKVIRNGGIFEHPAGSSFFKDVGIKPTISIDQSWFGFPARKRTYLYFKDCRPLAYPLSFNAPICPNVSGMNGSNGSRSKTTLQLAQWFVDCINASRFTERGNKSDSL